MKSLVRRSFFQIAGCTLQAKAIIVSKAENSIALPAEQSPHAARLMIMVYGETLARRAWLSTDRALTTLFSEDSPVVVASDTVLALSVRVGSAFRVAFAPSLAVKSMGIGMCIHPFTVRYRRLVSILLIPSPSPLVRADFASGLKTALYTSVIGKFRNIFLAAALRTRLHWVPFAWGFA